MKRFLVAIIFLLFLFVLPKPTFADNEFSTSYNVNYDVGADGLTDVTEKVTLKNLTDKFHASNFTLTIGSTTLTDVTANDQSGAMETAVNTKDNKTSIEVKFNQQLTGAGKTQSFTLKFKSKDFAQSLGKTWEVNLPKIPASQSIEGYDLTFSVPIVFGDPTSISPQPKSQSEDGSKLYFNFTREQLTTNGVSVNFGTNQIFDFNLKYQLENNALIPIVTSITLPPDTNFQDVSINNIDPQPLNVTLDEDGNFLAWFKLPQRSEQKIKVTGLAKLYINPKTKQFEILSSKEREMWLKPDVYWETNNPAIQTALAVVFKGKNLKSDSEKAEAIYRYVVATLKYDTSRLNDSGIERFGAVTALNNPEQAVCMEFTDLFIALARAAGLPSRELDGFAYSQNRSLRPLSLSKDLLHAWPEYYDENRGWVMVDPTWENTSGGVDYFHKFDLNHVVLAIKGVSSKSPYITNQVEVKVSDKEFKPRPEVEIKIDVSEPLFAGLSSTATIKILNRGNVSQNSTILKIDLDKMESSDAKEAITGTIPPFGYAEYKLDLHLPFNWQSSEGQITVAVGDQSAVKKVKISPIFLFYPIPYIFAGAMVLVIAVYAATLFFHLRLKN